MSPVRNKKIPVLLLSVLLPAFFICAVFIFFLYRILKPVFPPEPPPRLPEGQNLLSSFPPELDSIFPWKNDDAVVEIVPVSGLPFSSAVRAHTKRRQTRSYGIQLSFPIAKNIRQGDVIFARFYVRAAGWWFPTAKTQFIFEQSGGDYKKSLLYPVQAGRRWQKVDAAFKSAGSYGAGEASVRLRLGYGPQTIEIGGLTLLNCGSAAKVEGMQTTPIVYEGSESCAGWRKSAVKRINLIRKAVMRVKVADSEGNPVPSAEVHIRLVDHAFRFGSAVNSKFMHAELNNKSDQERYKKTVLRLFNTATIENDLKWPYWEGKRKIWGQKTVEWLNSNGVMARGHNLVWPSWRHLPETLKNLASSPELLRQAVQKHISEEAGHFRGKLAHWDVLNEPYTNHDLMDILGRESMAEWFKEARLADPSAGLYINETGIIDGGWDSIGCRNEYEKTIRSFIDGGVPLDGIGIQAHFNEGFTPPEEIIGTLDRFAEFKKPILITELDIESPNDKAKAGYLRDFMTAAFSHPSVEGIILWGFWEGIHSNPEELFFRKDWSPKPCAQVWEDLVFRQWHTDISAKTDKKGRFEARGFLGTYEITAALGERRITVKAELPKHGTEITIRLP